MGPVSSNVDMATELASFLRNRRERLPAPRRALPSGRRARRTPGLRREDVAELVGVSVDYIVRLEQGRGLRPSSEVREGLARALHLSDDEHAYLFDLTRRWKAPHTDTAPADSSLGRLVRLMSPAPAMLLNHRFDLLAWNPEMAGLMLDFGELPPPQRNILWLCVLHPALSGFYRDRERVIREAIADLRAAWAAHPDDPDIPALVQTLTGHDDQFASLWEDREIKVNGQGLKDLQHPRLDALTVEYFVLAPVSHPALRMVVYRGADTASRAALARLNDVDS
jgi:transcriptional regulator with XRE-family HTH domain